MKTRSWFYTSGAIYALVAMCLAATPSYGAVTADPAKAIFTSPQQSATIKLSDNGAPVAAADIQGWQFLASGHDYKHMLTVEKMDGALKISPSTTMEVGSYDLIIATAKGTVSVTVLAPLSDLPDVVEKMAALTGASENKIKGTMGLTTTLGRNDVELGLPPVYYEGQTLELTMAVEAGNSCAWFMNGDSVAEGPEQNKLTYTFKEPGAYVLTYVETKQENGKTVTVAYTTEHTRVVSVPAIPVEVAVNTEMAYASPSGYQKHVWLVDGKEVSTDSSLKHRFVDPGVHTVECLSSAPVRGPEQGFLRIRYTTTVNPK